MVQVQHLIGPTCFPSVSLDSRCEHLSIISYNVLLPNSVDGWWNYKMYLPPLTDEQVHWSTWDYRRNLIKKRLETVDADVVCLQEVAPESFADDFSFMVDLGYDNEMFKKGRFRPATFWKRNKLELASPPVHKDRTLLTAFRIIEDGKTSPNTWYALNCHLQAGREGKRRVRQINEGVRAVMTLAKKMKAKQPDKVPLVVCGDFNGGAECGAVRYLEDGFVDESFLEDGEAIVSSRKEMPLKHPLVDAMVQVDRDPPSTLVVSELISSLIESDERTAYDDPQLSKGMLDRLRRIYDKFAAETTATGDSVMGLSDVEQWLVTINKQLGRGSEYREAAKQMGWKDDKESDDQEGHEAVKTRITLPPGGVLTFEGFHNVYLAELRQGKFWGIAYDMAILGEPLPEIGLFQSRYDRMYTSTAIETVAVMDFSCNAPCPNELEPSDHLPIAGLFSLPT